MSEDTTNEPETTPTQDGGAEMTRAERIFVRLSILQTIIAVAGIFTGAVIPNALPGIVFSVSIPAS